LKKLAFILIFLLIVAKVSHAQYISEGGRFSVDNIRGCAPFTINITATNLVVGANCTPCNMDYLGNNTTQQNLLTFTYTTPGTYRLSVNYPNSGPDFINVTVDNNVQPPFEVYTCSGSQVSLKITDQTYDQYFVDFGDGSPILPINKSNNQVAQYTYSAATPVSIRVNGKKNNAANNCSTRNINFTPVSTLPLPQITQLTAVDASTLKLDFVQPVNVQYKLEMATNTQGFVQLQSLFGVATSTITNLNLDNNYYCFRLSSYDACNFINNYSQTICSHRLAVTPQNGQIKIDWPTNTTGVSRVDIARNATLYNTINNGATVSFVDPDVICKTNYCYQLTSTYSWGGKSVSLSKCGTAFSSNIPATIINATSIVESDGVKISWIQPPLFTVANYSILKASGTGTFNFLDNALVRNYQDKAFIVGADQCYKINYLDLCDNRSLNSNPICPIQLTGVLSDENLVTLNWNAYTGWNAGVKNYEVVKYDQAGNLIATIDRGLNLSYAETDIDLANQIVFYKIIAKPNESGILQSESNQIRLAKPVNLFFPTAFTPDRKGPVVNETFKVQGQYVKKMELSIFDRWGAVVFYTDKGEGWDGLQNGQPMPISTYVWVATVTDAAGNTYQRSGTVVLMRK
jgi:gliding motility-associated-like protein